MTKSAVQAIETLVRCVAENAAQTKVKLNERTEALRVLAPYYVALTKHQRLDVSDDPVTINSLQNAVRKADNGRTVSDHQRGRGEEAVED